MNLINKERLAYILSFGILFISSSFFENTKGFAYGSKTGEINYVSEAYGSGADDNIVIVFGAYLFFIPFIIGLLRLKRKLSFIEYLLLILCISLQVIFIIYGLDIGDYIYTLIITDNYLLWVITFSYVCTFIWCIYSLLRYKKNS